MANSATIVLITFEASAVLFVALGIPLLRRKVRPNWLYGYRTPATLNDPKLWYEVNARTGLDLIGTGVVLGVLAPVLAASCRSMETVVLVCTGWLLAGTLFTVLHGALFIREFRERADRDGPA